MPKFLQELNTKDEIDYAIRNTEDKVLNFYKLNRF